MELVEIQLAIVHLVVVVDAGNFERLCASDIGSAPVDVADLGIAVVDVITSLGARRGIIAATGADLGIVVGAACQPVDGFARDFLVLIVPEKELAAATRSAGPLLLALTDRHELRLCLLVSVRISKLEVRSRLHLVLDHHVDPLVVSHDGSAKACEAEDLVGYVRKMLPLVAVNPPSPMNLL